ncbi:hypothetical protein BGX27_003247, partial [Mortierella sp. AM989]
MPLLVVSKTDGRGAKDDATISITRKGDCANRGYSSDISAFAPDLLPPIGTFRDPIDATIVHPGPAAESHGRFFTKMLGEVEAPAPLFGVSNVQCNGVDVTELHIMLPRDLNDRLRGHTKRMGVSLASICHLAWAQVVSRASGQEQVVFGTVLFGHMRGGSDSNGTFINTLPLCIDVGDRSVEGSVCKTQNDLAALLEHGHAPLSFAQQCSNVPDGTPLFSSVLNCRSHIDQPIESFDLTGITLVDGKQRTNYPLTMSVDDFGTELSLTAQVAQPIDALRICEYMHQSLQSLAEALDHTPNMQVRHLEILPIAEREMLLEVWNDVTATNPEDRCIHQLFEDQVAQSPDAIAVVYEDQEISYYELNARSNSLAHHLIDLGVKPESL